MVCKRFLSTILLVTFLLSLANVSAFSFDNSKSSIHIPDGDKFSVGGKALNYNPIWKTYSPIQIKNIFGLGKTLFEGALTQHDEFCGIDCQSTMQIHLAEDSVLIDDVNFYTLSKDNSWIEQDIRGYQFTINGNPYSLGEEVSAGTYEVRLDGQKSPKRTVDWVITTQGEKLESWATWGNISDGDDAEVILNSPADDYVSPFYEILFNASATITGGATIVNMSLWTNETGTWESKGLMWNSDSRLYDDFNDNSMNTSLWTNATTKSGVGQVVSTTLEQNNQFEVYSYGSGAGDSVSYGTATLETDEYFYGYLKWTATDVITARTGTPTGGAYASVEVNNVIIVDKGLSYSTPTYDDYTTGTWELKSTSNTNHTLYKNSVFVREITSNLYNGKVEFKTYAYKTSASATSTCKNYIDNVYLNPNDYRTLNHTIAETTDWNVQVCDSDDDYGFAEYNRTALLDSTTPMINVTYPEGTIDYGYFGQNFTFNWTATDTGSFDTCWYNYNNTNTTVTCTDQNTSFILTDQNNMTFYANDSVSNEVNFTRTWVYKLFENSKIYNSTTYETATEGFRINITSDGTQSITANLIYSGVSYTGTKIGNNLEMEFNRNIDIPIVAIATAQNKTFYWNVSYGSEAIATTANNQSVGRTVFGLCNATLTTPYINFTFEDEETTIATNATIDSSTWYYYLGDGTVNKSLLYSTTNANESYGFCFMPSDKTMENTISLQYSDTGYPQRRWTSTTDLTNTTTNQKLYMLESADGTYSVYQVQTSVGGSISGVKVQAERQFSGVWTLVEEGETDSAGAVTFWLNPDYDHRLTFTKTGYTSIQVTVRPSSSTYTLVMGTGVEEATYNSTTEGLSWKIYPNLGKILFPNTTQIFLFNITANLSNIVTCKMEIINNNSVSLGTTIGCDSKGGNLSLSIPLGQNRSIRGVYSVDIGEGYFVIDADAYWIIMETNIPERGTIVAFFKYARNLNEFGSDNNRQEYSRVVFFFLMLSIIMGSICYSTGWDFSTQGGSIVFLTFIVWIASYGGFLTLSYTGVNGWMDQYVVALITGLFTGGFVLNKMAREA